MAHPARLARVQRARARRRLASNKRIHRFQPRSALAHRLFDWLSFFSQYLHVPCGPGQRTRAAAAARAALQDTAFTPTIPELAHIPTHEQQRRLRISALSLRYAAHSIAAMLVLAVVLLTSQVSFPAEGMVAQHLEQTQPLDTTGDLRIERQLSYQPAANAAVTLPAQRGLQAQAIPAFTERHVAAEGETLGQIAAHYHVSVESLFWANDFDTGRVFSSGEDLRIPRMSGLPHIVEAGDTLESIAAFFHVQPEAISLFKANNSVAGQPLLVGQELFVPGGTRAYADDVLARYGGEQGIASLRAVVAGTVQQSDTNLRVGPGREYPRLSSLDAGRKIKLIARHAEWVKVDSGGEVIGWVRSDLLGIPDATMATLAETNDFPAPPPRWVWPARGSISSPFGWRSAPWHMFHDGIDIANRAGTQIVAARAGEVIEAGWCRGFGYCVKLDHGEGITTIYGHMLKRPPVRTGETVAAGDLIGLMGSTYDASGGGYSTGVHLHFTVKVNGKAVDPRKFLP